jgi:hypothetical protein
MLCLRMLCDMVSFGLPRLRCWQSTKVSDISHQEYGTKSLSAHHCIKKHPANIIIKNFYHELKATDANVPHILSLPASLIMSLKLGSVS